MSITRGKIQDVATVREAIKQARTEPITTRFALSKKPSSDELKGIPAILRGRIMWEV